MAGVLKIVVKEVIARYASKVNGHEISVQDYNSEYTRMVEQARQMYGEKFNDEMAQEMGLGVQVLDELENRELILEQATKMGITVSDDELRIALFSQKAFSTGGKFDPNLYRRYLQQQGKSPETFENEIRTDRMLSKLQNLVTDFVKVSEPEIRDEFLKENEKITVEALRFCHP